MNRISTRILNIRLSSTRINSSTSTSTSSILPSAAAALRSANRIGCSDHYINKRLEHSFTLSKSRCVEAVEVFDIIKTLVTNIRRCHRQIKLSRKLQTFSPTRFSGVYYMLVSFI